MVESLLPIPSVSMWHGKAGCGKTNLLMDLCISIALGEPWLDCAEGRSYRPFATIPGATAILNYDTPTWLMHERINAFLASRNAPMTTPFSYWSFPPTLDASNEQQMNAFSNIIKSHGLRFLVVDNLQQVRGKVEENSAEMGQVLRTWRVMTERLGISIALIHHERKEGGFRGSTSIGDLVDSSFCVSKGEKEGEIQVKPGKERFAPVKPFACQAVFDNDQTTRQIKGARIYRVDSTYIGRAEKIKERLLDEIRKNPGITKTSLGAAGLGARREILYGLIDQLMLDGTLTIAPNTRGGLQYV
jgi:hypothetical protein